MSKQFACFGCWEWLRVGFPVGNVATARDGFVIGWRAVRNGTFLYSGAMLLSLSVLFDVPGGTAAWRSINASFAAIPAATA